MKQLFVQMDIYSIFIHCCIYTTFSFLCNLNYIFLHFVHKPFIFTTAFFVHRTSLGRDGSSEWLEPVTDEQYGVLK